MAALRPTLFPRVKKRSSYSWAAKKYNALVTDVNLGSGLNGWEVAKRIREKEPGFPVISMTASEDRVLRLVTPSRDSLDVYWFRKGLLAGLFSCDGDCVLLPSMIFRGLANQNERGCRLSRALFMHGLIQQLRSCRYDLRRREGLLQQHAVRNAV